MENNDLDLYRECDTIIDSISDNLSNDQKLRKMYIEVGKLLSKSPEFFYEKDPVRQREIYDNYKVIQDREVICKSVVYLYCNLAEKLGLKCRPIETDDMDGVQFNHWALVYENDDKKYLINPIPDFYRVQLGFSTKSFCHSEDYHAYSSESFDSMSDEYLRELDLSIGYLDSGYYTDEILEKLSTEMRNKLGTHIVRTSDYYQNYYLTLLNLISDQDLSIEDKLSKIEEIDFEFEKNKELIIDTINNGLIDSSMKRAIHTGAYKKLIGSVSNFSNERDGASFVGSIDVTNLKEMKNEIMLYKFNYMMNCIPRFTDKLTGYIENKNFMEEMSKYFFQSPEEKECVHRHTVVKDVGNGKKDYYLMFSIRELGEDDSFYCFYDHKEKTFQMPIEPIDFMIKNKMAPLKNSTLNEKLSESIKVSPLCSNSVLSINQNVAKK